MEALFALFFGVETLLRIHQLGLDYFLDAWNVYDYTLVTLSVADVVVSITVPGSGGLGIAKMLRICRLLRIYRSIKGLKALAGLWVITQGILDSLLAVVWVSFALFLFLFMFAVLVTTMVGQDIDIRREWSGADLYVGGVWKSMLTILQVFTIDAIASTLGQPLMTISPITVGLLVISIVFLNFGCINILVAVMVEHIVNIATETRVNFAKVLAKVESKVFAAMLEELTEYCDDGEGGGELTYKDFKKVIRNKTMMEKMKLLNFCFDEMELLFELMDADGSGSVSPKEFVAGLRKMKGQALGSDVVRLIGLAHKQSGRALVFNRRLAVLNEKADIIQERLNFLGQHCSEELIERAHSEVRQEKALVESAQRQLVIIECDENRRTTYPGLVPEEPKKPLRLAPWELPAKPRRSSMEQAVPAEAAVLDPVPEEESPERRASMEPT
ncbi:Catsper1 [Symbiodinium pilosum]|uniref:Catsper1 protein n=1 Tax=Symbiodinium pilosum TaxID=2952 RepID=A0A812N2K8_SYMPI|nr:Catsper1 [Symbiodinium pilosum]